MARAAKSAAPLPEYRAQLATHVDQPPDGDAWIHEIEYDGYRAGCFVEAGSARLASRGGQDWTAAYPEVVAAAAKLPVRSALLDGELALLLPDGRTSFQALQNAGSGGAAAGQLVYFVFDLLYLDGRDLTALPLQARKAELEALLKRAKQGSALRYAGHLDLGGATVLEHACRLGLDGIVSKRRDLPYQPGQGASWQKSKCTPRRETEATPQGVRRAAEPQARGQRPVPTRAARPKIIAPASARKRSATGGETLVADITITTPERPIYPKHGFTKLDLARYYAAVAQWMLPYVAGRPLTLVRCERGVSKTDALRTECQFLKHTEAWHRWAGPSLERVQIAEQKKVGEYLVAASKEALVSLAQGDIVEVHCWGSRVPEVERPDRIVFDLDPAPDLAWTHVVAAAKLARGALAALGLESWPKLTGGKGVHVVVPFRPEHTWPAVYRFAHAFAGALAQQHPDVFTLDFGKGQRGGRVLIDYKRNHRAAVAVAAYSTRAHPDGTVSMPITWSELKASWPSDHFTVHDALRRLEKLKADPWRSFWECTQRLGEPKLAAATGNSARSSRRRSSAR